MVSKITLRETLKSNHAYPGNFPYTQSNLKKPIIEKSATNNISGSYKERLFNWIKKRFTSSTNNKHEIINPAYLGFLAYNHKIKKELGHLKQTNNDAKPLCSDICNLESRVLVLEQLINPFASENNMHPSYKLILENIRFQLQSNEEIKINTGTDKYIIQKSSNGTYLLLNLNNSQENTLLDEDKIIPLYKQRDEEVKLMF